MAELDKAYFTNYNRLTPDDYGYYDEDNAIPSSDFSTLHLVAFSDWWDRQCTSQWDLPTPWVPLGANAKHNP